MRTFGICWIGAWLALVVGAAAAQPAALGDPSYTAWFFELPPNASPDQPLGSPQVFRTAVGPSFYAEDTLGGARTIWGAPAGGTVYGTNTGLLWTTAATSVSALNGNTGVYIEADWQQVFRKESADAAMHFSITDLYLDLWDGNFGGFGPMYASVGLFIDVGEFLRDPNGQPMPVPSQPSQTFFASIWGDARPIAQGGLDGFQGLWTGGTLDGQLNLIDAHNVRPPTGWTEVPFGTLALATAYHGNIDLASIGVSGEFFVRYTIVSQVIAPGHESLAVARVLDPISGEGGFNVELEGVTALNEVVPFDPRPPVAVPEPRSAALGLLGLVGLLLHRRRAQRGR